MASEPTYPISDPRLILRACQAAEPLQPGDPRRYARLQKVFSGEPAASKYHHRVLCGHRGCGKSTELLQFKKWADENGFACVRIEVNVRLGHVSLEFSDFFLLAATAAEAGAQLGGKAPFGLAALFGKFTSGIKAGSSHAVQFRQQLRNYPDTLIDLTNALLEKAHAALETSHRPRGLVLLFDNLDRYEPEQIDQVLLRGSSLLEKLACHALFVIPIDLEYKPLSGPLRDSYGPPVVLPMVPLREREQPWRETVAESPHLETAVAGMRDALALRLQIEEIFEAPEDAERLVRMSGGCIRDLIHLVTLAFEMSEAHKLSTAGCDLAIQELRATYSRELASEQYQRLAEIAARQKVPRDELTQSLLFNRWALEYSAPVGGVWIDVHPLVIEIDEFREAYRRQSGLGA